MIDESGLVTERYDNMWLRSGSSAKCWPRYTAEWSWELEGANLVLARGAATGHVVQVWPSGIHGKCWYRLSFQRSVSEHCATGSLGQRTQLCYSGCDGKMLKKKCLDFSTFKMWIEVPASINAICIWNIKIDIEIDILTPILHWFIVTVSFICSTFFMFHIFNPWRSYVWSAKTPWNYVGLCEASTKSANA